MAKKPVSITLAPLRPTTSRQHAGAGFLIAICWLAAFLPMLDTSIVNLALPQLTDAFRLAPTDLGWITNAYLLPLVVSIPVFGRLGDATGRARLMVVGAMLFGCATLGAALSVSWVMLLAMRALQGLGASAIATMSMAVVSSSFPPGRERDGALGWYLSGPAFGGALGPIAGAALTALGGWHLIFLAQVPLAFIIVIGGMRLSSPSNNARKSLDPLGMFLAAVTLFCISLALLQSPSWGWLSWRVIMIWVFALAGGWVFVVHERHTAHPLVALQVFKNRIFLGSGIAGAALWFGVISGFMLLPLYLETARGMTSLHASLLLGAWPLGALLTYPFAGRIVARWGPASMAKASLTVTVFASIAMMLYGKSTSDVTLVVVGLPLGAATAVGQVATAAGAVSEFANRDAGVAAAMFNILRQIGSLLGGALPISMLATGGASVGVTYSGLYGAFATRFVVLVVSLLVAHALLNRNRVLADGQAT